MLDYLVDHAIKNVWCTPEQDKQYIFKPQKVSSPHGVMNRVVVMDRVIRLPTVVDVYHVYQIGHLNPEVLGLRETDYDVWQTFTGMANERKMIVNVYMGTGVELPRSLTYYMWTRERALLICTKQVSRYPISYVYDPLYIRVYSNAYFSTYLATSENDVTYLEYAHPTSTDEILALQIKYNNYNQLGGHTYAIVNGYYRETLDLITVKIGDYVELIHDGSVREVVDLCINDLPTFLSTRDKQTKYVCHPNKNGVNIIDYFDDVDIYIVNKGDTRPRGIYYHKNSETAVRMLTHRDYSLNVGNVNVSLLQLRLKDNSVAVNNKNTYVRLLIKHSGYTRPLVYENSRIHELYKLTDKEIINVMAGSDKTIAMWQAAALENSDYVNLFSAKTKNMNRDYVVRTYGYNGITKVAADTPFSVTIENGIKIVNPPYVYTGESTAYEYDANGILLSYHNHKLGNSYKCVNDNASYVEMVSGRAGINLDTVHGVGPLTINTNINYRVYMTEEYPYDRITYAWLDVTGTDWYDLVGNVLTGKAGYYYLVRYDNRFLVNDFTWDGERGICEFDITEQFQWVTNEGVRPLMVPLSDLVIFLNGYSLIEGLDYYVDFPKVRLTSKEYLLPTGNKFHIRFSGFCNKDLTWNKPEDVGFIYHGNMSANSVFDIRDDRVVRMAVGGKLLVNDNLHYAESGMITDILNQYNGKPYEVRGSYIPLKDLVSIDSKTLQSESKKIDRVISAYLTLKFPQRVIDAPSAIVDRYVLYSPFVARVISDLSEEIIDISELGSSYEDVQVIELLKGYEYILKTDPTLEENLPDLDYVTIHPIIGNEPVYLNLFQYRFIYRVVSIYSQNLIDLSAFIKLKEID